MANVVGDTKSSIQAKSQITDSADSLYGSRARWGAGVCICSLLEFCLEFIFLELISESHFIGSTHFAPVHFPITIGVFCYRANLIWRIEKWRFSPKTNKIPYRSFETLEIHFANMFANNGSENVYDMPPKRCFEMPFFDLAVVLTQHIHVLE